MVMDPRPIPVTAIVLMGLCLILSVGTTQAAIPTSEREALIALYWSTNGDSWWSTPGWLGPAGTECSWYGVTCDAAETTVTELYLSDRNLSGVLPPEIGDLTNLENLRLGGNHISGGLPPEIGNLVSLRSLDLSGLGIDGPLPAELGDLVNLEDLDLYSCGITAPIPSEIGNLASLKQLWMGFNKINGPLPSEIGQLASIELLYLNQSGITGPIPPEIGQLDTLVDLHLRSNRLSGAIPPEIGNLPAVQTIDLRWNELTGSIPPEIGNLAAVIDLDFAENQLTGPIPPELADLATVRNIDLSGNRLTGSIPPELGNLVVAHALDLSSNNLSGSIPPEIGNLGSIWALRLNNNSLSGPIPPELRFLAGSGYIYLGSNLLTGEVPAAVAELCPITQLNLMYNSLQATDAAVAAALDSCSNSWRYQGVPPTDIEVLAVSPRFVSFGWTPIVWSDHGSYEVLVSTTPGGPYRRITSTALAFDKGVAGAIAGPLEADTTYSAVVRSVNYPVVSSFSSELIFATPPAATTFAAVTGDDLNDCLSPSAPCRTIQAAIDKAGDSGMVKIEPGTYTENLIIDTSLVIEGSRDAPTVINGGARGSVVSIASGLQVALDRLQITNGDAQQGGGVFNGGGAVFILESEIASNRAVADGGAIHNHGGIVVVEDSAIVQNTSGSDSVVSRPPYEVEPGAAGFRNSTISGNVSTDVYSRVMGPATLMYSTVVDNRAGDEGIILERIGSRYVNTIIAENHSPICNPQPWGYESLGHNLADTDECFDIYENGSDLMVMDPMIEGLANNGGPTRTHALSPGSPAIDTGDSRGAPAHDQRGADRPVDGDGNGFAETDIGAFEFGSIVAAVFDDGFETGDASRWSLTNPAPPSGDAGSWSGQR